MNDKYIDCMNCANKENCDNYQSHKDESGHWEREQDSCSKYQEVESNNTTSNKSNKKDKNKPSINSLPARQRKPLFDVVIGNPPYQSSTIGENDSYAPPVYHEFIDASAEIAEKALLIHPARFLFNAGGTPKQWNKKMLQNEHFSILKYEPNSKAVFPNADIKGGIVISLNDNKKTVPAIGVFTAHNELNTIVKKVLNSDFISFKKIAFSAYSYKFTKVLYTEHPELIGKSSSSHEYDLKSNVFEYLSDIFYEQCPADGNYIQILGRLNNERTFRWVKKDYILSTENFNKYKIFIAGANGSGSIGEVMSSPIISAPYIGATESFMSIGSFDTKKEAENCTKYIKTKFNRALLGVLKVTQNITPEKYYYVPLQDFTDTSDVPWEKSISEIDQYLYKKYSLSEEEINFIENNIKEMK